MRRFSFQCTELTTLVEGICGVVQDKPVEISLVEVVGSQVTYRRFEGVKFVQHKTLYVSMEGLRSVDILIEIVRDVTYAHLASAGTGFHTVESSVEVVYDLDNNIVTLFSRPTTERIIVTIIRF